MDWVLIKLVFYHYADKMYFLLLLWGNQENHIFWRFLPVKLILKFVLYGVPDHSALIFKFVNFAIVLVALPQGKNTKANVEACALLVHGNEGDAWQAENLPADF